MKGLLVKDLSLIKMQKRYFIMTVALAIVLTAFMNDMFFMMGYLTYVVSIFAVSTISYDEADNGFAFLFTLPITRKGYVIEKYCFGMLLGIAALIFSSLLALGYGLAKGMDAAAEAIKIAPIFFLVALAILSVMMPLQLKFGAEKARIALIIFAGIVFALIMMAAKISEALQLDLASFFERSTALELWGLFAGAFLLIALVVFASVKLSISIMTKKEL